MDKKLIISRRPSETRIALLDKMQLTELFIEKESDKSILGNIYKGKVTRVLPGMQAAFVDIGLGRATFLYAGDVLSLEEIETKTRSHYQKSEEVSDEEEFSEKNRVKNAIGNVLSAGQEILVQVAKEPLGTKGARVTMNITLPGRYLVYLPQFNHLTTSKRIDDEKEKERLLSLISEIKNDDAGIIIRTAAINANAAHFKKDLDYLQRTWKKVEQKARRTPGPALIHQDLDLVEKTTRDLYSDEISEIQVDSDDLFKKLKYFLRATIPGASSKIQLYSGQTNLFDVYDLDNEIEKALSNRVELPSGGYLIIEQTEALTTIDVNTGKYVGKHNADETIFKTNLEAVKKIVSQIRLRNIGGIIILDLIDMEKDDHRNRIYTAFQEELKQDRARVTTLEINALGLIEMTRKRTQDSLERQIMEPCPYCSGQGRVKNTVNLAHEVLRDIERYTQQTGEKQLVVRAREDVVDWILEFENHWLESVSKEHDVTVEFETTSCNHAALSEPLYEVFSYF